MFCSISGEVPQEPVVSRISGHLFEKRLVEKYIKDQGKCPMTSEALSVEDLLPVQASKALRPRPISGTSIPGLLVAFQNEWDEVMLETFTLKQHLDTTRQELAQALYQHDAACRVIARLMQERDEARQQLASLGAGQVQSTNNSDATEMAVEEAPQNGSHEEKETVGQLNERVVQELVSTCADLSAGRKARKGSASTAPSREAVQQLSVLATHSPHKGDAKTGITCVAVQASFPISQVVAAAAPAKSAGNKRGKAAAADEAEGPLADGAVVMSGGSDKSVLLTQLDSGRVLAKITGHQKKVTAVSFHCTVSTAATATSTHLFSASADHTVRMWSADNVTGTGEAGHYREAWNYKGHEQEVHSLCMHPSGKYLVSIATGGWHFLDIGKEGTFLQGTRAANYANDPAAAYSCGAFHPDGLILGTGSASGALRIWDVRTLENPHTLPGHPAGTAMTCLSFSENGYQAASGGADGSVRLWDLRKLTYTQSLDGGHGPVGSVAFDYSGVYLAVGGTGAGEAGALSIRAVKDWTEVADLSNTHSKAVTGVAWLGSSGALVSCAMDRTIKHLGDAAH